MQEELPQPLYFSFHGMTSFLKMTAPKYVEVSFGGKVYRQIVSALRRAGYHTSQCHCDPLALKTDAPGDVVFDVFRAYFREKQLPQDEKWEARQPEAS